MRHFSLLFARMSFPPSQIYVNANFKRERESLLCYHRGNVFFLSLLIALEKKEDVSNIKGKKESFEAFFPWENNTQRQNAFKKSTERNKTLFVVIFFAE